MLVGSRALWLFVSLLVTACAGRQQPSNEREPGRTEEARDPAVREGVAPESDVDEDLGFLPDPNEGDLSGLPPPPASNEGNESPWATRFLAALSNADVDPAVNGALRFKLRICEDGRIEVRPQDGTVSDADRPRLVEALERTAVPAPPPPVRRAMKRPCAMIKYVFEWEDGIVK